MRTAVQHAVYPRPVSMAGEIVGPNALGEYLVAVAEEPAGTGTRVGFAYVTQPDLEAAWAARPPAIPATFCSTASLEEGPR